jgi:hypothetical protein
MLFFCSDLSQFTPKVQKFEAFGGVQVQPRHYCWVGRHLFEEDTDHMFGVNL